MSNAGSELHCITGKVHINKDDHRIALAGQNPWLEHATIRENILYGCPFDHDRYEMVLDACSLENDLAILPGGDLTGLIRSFRITPIISDS